MLILEIFCFLTTLFMQQKNSLLAYTLMELLVVITIIGIIAIWTTQLDFNRLSQKQQVSIEAIKIINIIEEVRNNALTWKWIWVTLETPDAWKIDISRSASGTVTSSYTLNDGSSWTPYSFWSWQAPFPQEIESMECYKLDGSSESISTPISISFTGSVWSLSGCSDNNYKIFTFIYGIANLKHSISINALTWVIEID